MSVERRAALAQQIDEQSFAEIFEMLVTCDQRTARGAARRWNAQLAADVHPEPQQAGTFWYLVGEIAQKANDAALLTTAIVGLHYAEKRLLKARAERYTPRAGIPDPPLQAEGSV